MQEEEANTSIDQQSTEEIIKLNPDLALLYKGPEAAKVRELALAEQKERAVKKKEEKERRRAEMQQRELELENQRNGVGNRDEVSC